MTPPTERHLPGLSPALAEAVARAAGGEAWLVGGFVRDRLLARAAIDADVAIAGDPRAAARRLAAGAGGHAFPLSEEHGAWRVTLDGPGEVRQIDITRLRGPLEDDLRLRDFTINAVALPLGGGAPVDPLGGVADLHEGLVRTASDSAVRADPIRALRAVRHAAELGFRIDPASAAQVRAGAALLAGVSGERQRDELVRILNSARGADGLLLMDGLGLLEVTLPELAPARGCRQPPEHYWDVLEHSIETVRVLDCLLTRDADNDVAPPEPAAACLERRRQPGPWWNAAAAPYWDAPLTPPRPRRALLKLVGLLHDAGKPAARSVDDAGRIRFFGHDERGAVIAEAAFQRLRFSSAESRYAALLVREHLRPGQLAQPGQQPTARALFRLFRDLGADLPDLLLLNLADGAAAAGPRQRPEQWAAHVAYATWVLAQREAQRERAGPARLLTGHDLMAELGMEPGPALGRLLDALAEAQAAGEVDSREAALALARSLRDRDPDR